MSIAASKTRKQKKLPDPDTTHVAPEVVLTDEHIQLVQITDKCTGHWHNAQSFENQVQTNQEITPLSQK